ncbi:bestrophin family protein [Citrobacter farmeri]|nr:bestrophin family protein [Citrobacter farmeri]HCC5835593.1 bestrophin family protein [Citrobacter farmeri]
MAEFVFFPKIVMIVRPQQHWLRLIFVWHGSVLAKISSRLLLNFLLSIAVIVLLPWYTMLGIKFTLAPFSILGVAIAIFLGFRNNACYSRYVEARQLWGQLMIASRSLLREVKTVLPDDRELGQFVRLQIAFAHCLRMTLRRKPQAESLAKYLSPEDLQRVFACHSPANRILLIMGEWLATRRRDGELSDILFHSLNNRLNDMSAVLAGCERIANTPVPFAYTLILHRTVYLFCIMLPFALVVDLHYMTPFISVLISYTFISLDALAEELEDPFGTENNDLPLDAICNAIEIDLLQMNDESAIPPKLMPDKHYQLT